eukprot:gene12136-13389_t
MYRPPFQLAAKQAAKERSNHASLTQVKPSQAMPGQTTFWFFRLFSLESSLRCGLLVDKISWSRVYRTYKEWWHRFDLVGIVKKRIRSLRLPLPRVGPGGVLLEYLVSYGLHGTG